MRIKVEQFEDGKWYKIGFSEISMCCDCCLVHKVKYKIKDGKLWGQWKRDDRSTAGHRRAKEARKIIKKLI